MGIFSKKKLTSEMIEKKIKEELDYAANHPEEYSNCPKNFLECIDNILKKAPENYSLPEQLKNEFNFITEYIYYSIEIRIKPYTLPLFYEFKRDIEIYRKIAAIHASEQKEKIEQFRRDGFNGKKWVCNCDYEINPDHRRVNNQISRLDSPFYLPGDVKLMYPGDPNGPKDETLGCICDMVPVILEHEFY